MIPKDAPAPVRAAAVADLDLQRARSAFLAHMRHELRTPINAIIGYSEMLLEDSQGAGQEPFAGDLRQVLGSGQELLQRVNEILDPTVIEREQPELDLEGFHARISHALRTPLTHIIGCCELLAEEAGETDQARLLPDLERIHAAAERLLGLISDILQFSQVEAGRAVPDLDSGSIPTLIRDVLTSIPTLGPYFAVQRS